MINLIKSLLLIIAITFIFFNWKISIILFLIAIMIHVIPAGPNLLLTVITGFLMIGGAAYLLIDWKIGVLLILGSFIVSKFRLWGNKVNYEHYKNIRHTTSNDK